MVVLLWLALVWLGWKKTGRKKKEMVSERKEGGDGVLGLGKRLLFLSFMGEAGAGVARKRRGTPWRRRRTSVRERVRRRWIKGKGQHGLGL